jgi:Carboxypeptidase regulatory-like domain
MPRTAVLAALLISACIPFGDGGVTVVGTVRDTSGSPVVGAHAWLQAGGRRLETQSDNAGRFNLSSMIAPGRYSLVLHVEQAGYKPGTAAVKTLRTNSVAVTLANDAEPEASSVQVTEPPS